MFAADNVGLTSTTLT